MNIFNLRDNVINAYQQYVESFLNIQDEQIRDFVSQELSSGIYWQGKRTEAERISFACEN